MNKQHKVDNNGRTVVCGKCGKTFIVGRSAYENDKAACRHCGFVAELAVPARLITLKKEQVYKGNDYA